MYSYLLLLLSVAVVEVVSMAIDSGGFSESDKLQAKLVDGHRMPPSMLRYKRSGPRTNSRQNVAWNTNKSIVYVVIAATVLLSIIAAFIHLIWTLCNRRKKFVHQTETGCSTVSDNTSSSCSVISE